MLSWATQLVTGVNSDFPYKADSAAQPIQCAGWTLQAGIAQNSNQPVTIHSFSLTDGASPEVAQRVVQRLKTMRHPNILKFLGSSETATEIVMATEPVKPLEDLLATGDELVDVSRHPAALLWGIRQIAQGLGFVQQAGLVHGSFNPSSVMVTRGGDWKLAGFEVATEHSSLASGAVPDTRPLAAWFPKAYSPPENSTGADYPPWAWDMWGLGCLIYELWDSKPNPQPVKAAWSKLVSKTPGSRLTPDKLLAHAALKGKHSQALLFLEEIAIKQDEEKAKFYSALPEMIKEMPSPVAKYKVSVPGAVCSCSAVLCVAGAASLAGDSAVCWQQRCPSASSVALNRKVSHTTRVHRDSTASDSSTVLIP